MLREKIFKYCLSDDGNCMRVPNVLNSIVFCPAGMWLWRWSRNKLCLRWRLWPVPDLEVRPSPKFCQEIWQQFLVSLVNIDSQTQGVSVSSWVLFWMKPIVQSCPSLNKRHKGFLPTNNWPALGYVISDIERWQNGNMVFIHSATKLFMLFIRKLPSSNIIPIFQTKNPLIFS